MSAVTVVIPSWNTREDLRSCLESLRAHTVSASLDVVVVDNASTDGTREMLASSFPDVRLIGNSTNVGFARACNQGMAAASGEFVLVLNSDTYVCDDVIGRAVAALAARPDVGMLGCELRFPDGRRQHTANRALSIRQSLFERLWLYKLLPAERRGLALLGGYWNGSEEIEVDWLAGAFLLVRTSVFERWGGFDERFFMYGEDSEWCMRLRRRGVRILYAPETGVVYHTGCVSADLVWTDRQRLARCYCGGVESYAMIHGPGLALLYRLAETFGASVRTLAYRAASVVAPRSVYFREQAEFFAWLARLYVSMPLHPLSGLGRPAGESHAARSLRPSIPAERG